MMAACPGRTLVPTSGYPILQFCSLRASARANAGVLRPGDRFGTPVTWSLAKTFETWLRAVFSDMTRPHSGRLERWSFRAVMTAMTLVSVGGAGVLLDVGPQRTAHRTLLPRVESRPQLGWRTASPRRLKTRDTGQW